MRLGTEKIVVVLWCASVVSIWASDPAQPHPDEAPAPDPAAQIALLTEKVAEQRKQIEQLRANLVEQERVLNRLALAVGPERPGTRRAAGELASSTPMLVPAQIDSNKPSMVASVALPGPFASPQNVTPAAQPPGPTLTDVNGRLSAYIRNVVRVTGDLRFRYDLQARSSNDVAGPLQNSRERYRLRFNFDRDLFLRDNSATPWARVHAQLATAPFNNSITMDTDYSGIDTRAPISVSEAWWDLAPLHGLTLRAGRTSELFADNRQFVWDDDVRLNGFHEIYHFTAKNGVYVEVRAAQYILTNPNVPVVPVGSPYLTAGYVQGQKVRSSVMYDEGVIVGGNFNKKWSANGLVNYNVVSQPNQIQLASTAAGFPLLTSPVVGATLTGALPQVGNATTTNGGAIYFAEGFHVIHGSFNLNYSGSTWAGHNWPVQFFAQATHNTKASIANNGYMIGANVGQVAKLGDVQFQYQYFYKPANAFISQFSDDDVGTGSGVNVKVNHIRLNFGMTRFLVWENRVFFQKGIARSNPAINFFVPLQQGYNLSTRLQSQFLFTF